MQIKKPRMVSTVVKNMLVAGVLACLTITSCQKESISDMLSQQNTTDVQQRYCKTCQVSSAVDYSGNSFKVVYKSNGNPDTIYDLNYGTIKMNYGIGGRLTSANFLQTGASYLFYYKPGCNEPSRVVRNLSNGIVLVDSFFYSANGNMIKYVSDGITAGQYRIVYNINYNNNRNVTQSNYSLFDAAGNLVTAYTENAFATYDNKPNYINNKWIKYILIHVGFNYYDVFKLFSKNNPVDYTLNDGADIYNVHSVYTYNNNFATINEMQSSDQATGTNTFILYEFAGSTCDSAPVVATGNGIPISRIKMANKPNWIEWRN